VIPMSPSHRKWSPNAQVMVVLVLGVSAFYRAEDSVLRGLETPAQNVFSLFSSEVPKPLGTFARPETPTLGFGDSSRHNFLGGARPRNGSRSLLDACPETWARDSGPQRPKTPGCSG
jgi:hypothetical protein